MVQQTASAPGGEDRDTASRFLRGLARGGAGALLFSLPLLMTMEMWELGVYVSREKLLLLLVVNMPLLALLAYRIGFERTTCWSEAIRDAIVAYGIGIVTSALVLVLIGILKADMSMNEAIGKIAIQSVPASVGALLGRSQLGTNSDEEKSETRQRSAFAYITELFLMAVGALFLSLNVAPTEEMILVSYKMSYWHAFAAVVVSIALMHGFVYAVSFIGGHELSPETPWWHAFVRFTLPGYTIALAISCYTLWTFERLNDSAPLTVAMTVIVLSMPGAIGAAAARLIL